MATYGGRTVKDASVFDPESKTFSTSQQYRRMWVNDNFCDSDQSINQGSVIASNDISDLESLLHT